MNRKQFAILLVLLVVLGGAGLYIQKNRKAEGNAGGQGAGQKLLGDKFEVNDIAQIAIKQGSNEVNLVKKDDVWRVKERNNYPANFSEIRDFLMKARDLKVIQKEEIGASQLPRLELNNPGPAVILDLKDKDGKSLKSLTLGKKHVRKPTQQQQAQFGEEGIPDGRYVQLSGDTKSALLIADPLSNIEPKPAQWVDKVFFKIEKPKTISVKYANETNSWKISRETESGDWKLADLKSGEQLDTNKVTGVTTPFASASFNDVKMDEAKADGAATTMTVETFDNFTYTIKIGQKAGEEYPVTMKLEANLPKERTPAKDEKPEDKEKNDKAFAETKKQLEERFKHETSFQGWTFMVPTWNLENVLKDRKDLLVDTKEDAKATAAAVEPLTPEVK